MRRFPLPTQFADLFDPKKVGFFLFGAVILAVLGNACYDLLKLGLGDTRDGVLKIAVGSALILLAVAWVLTVWGRRPRAAVLDRAPPAARRGLIFLVGREEPLKAALKPHAGTLERVWLICSSQTSAAALELAADPEVTADGRRTVDVLQVADVGDPEPVYRTVRRVYAHLLPAGWDADDVIGDYVGMTAHASVGMVLACLLSGGPMQYTAAEFDRDLKAVRALSPHEVLLRWTRVRPSRPDA